MGPIDQSSSREPWRDAVAVSAVVFTVVLAAHHLRPLAEAGAFLARTGEGLTALPSTTWPRAVAWVLICVAVFARWRTVAAIGAWLAVVYEVVVLAVRVNGEPAYIDPLNVMAWPLLLAVAAAALLTVPAPSGRGLDLLGGRGRWLLAVAAALTTLTAVAIPLLGDYLGPVPVDPADPGFAAIFVFSSQLARLVAGLTLLLILAAIVGALIGVDRAVRRRVLTLAAAGIGGFVAIQLGLPRPFGIWEAPMLSGLSLAVLVILVPLAVLAAGVITVRLSDS